MFNRDFKALTEAADAVDTAADKIEEAYDFVVGFIDQSEGVVNQFLTKIRASANQMRNEAESQKAPGSDDVSVEQEVSIATRDEKISFILARLDRVGITDSKWNSPEFINTVRDCVIDATYKAFGGK